MSSQCVPGGQQHMLSPLPRELLVPGAPEARNHADACARLEGQGDRRSTPSQDPRSLEPEDARFSFLSILYACDRFCNAPPNWPSLFRGFASPIPSAPFSWVRFPR